jgi:hypothetical protein
LTQGAAAALTTSILLPGPATGAKGLGDFGSGEEEQEVECGRAGTLSVSPLCLPAIRK